MDTVVTAAFALFLLGLFLSILLSSAQRYQAPSSWRRKHNTDYTQHPHYHDRKRNGSHYWHP